MPLYNYAPKRKVYRKKRVFRKRPKSKLPLTKRQALATSRMISKMVNKTRETKKLYLTIDEENLAPTGTSLMTFNFPAASSSDIIANKTNRGDFSYQRNGDMIQPLNFNWKGVIKYQGFSVQSGYAETSVRIVFGFIDGDEAAAPITTADTDWMMVNGNNSAILSDFQAIYQNFNWRKFRPFYDKTIKLQPATQQTFDNTAPITTAFSSAPLSRFISVNHNFGKNHKMLQAYNGSSIYNKKNIVALVIARPTNDDVLVSTNSLEISGTGMFLFKDA